MQIEADHVRLVQDDKIDREHRTVWGAIHTGVELAQRRAEESTFTNLKTQVSKIYSSINSIKELTCMFDHLHQQDDNLENLEEERSGREGESSLGVLSGCEDAKTR